MLNIFVHLLHWVLYFLDDNLIHKDPTVQERAIAAVPSFVEEYFSSDSSKLDALIKHYVSQLDTSELHLRGFALALGSLPQNVLRGRLHQLLPVLIERTAVTDKKFELWAEGRRDVIKAIMNIIKTVGVSTESNQGMRFIYRKIRNKSRIPKMCYPKREGPVMPLLFWDNKFLVCGFYFGFYGIS